MTQPSSALPPRRPWPSPLRPGLWLAFGLVVSTASAHSQGTVYRCGAGQYSQQPCEGGKALPTDPNPDPARQQAAQAQAQRHAALADQLRQERLARERLAQGQAASRIGPPRAQAVTTSQQTSKQASRSSGPKTRKQPGLGDRENSRVALGPPSQKPANGSRPKPARAAPSAP